MNLRYRLVPSLVSAAARVTLDDGMPLVRRLDLEWPTVHNQPPIELGTSALQQLLLLTSRLGSSARAAAQRDA